jgi:TPR repeat protein
MFWSFGEVPDARGFANVGYCLHTSLGTGQNWDESMKYFRAAAELGDGIGQFHYGVCCYRAVYICICIDFVEALE